jgi:hypothetical protein
MRKRAELDGLRAAVLKQAAELIFMRAVHQVPDTFAAEADDQDPQEQRLLVAADQE